MKKLNGLRTDGREGEEREVQVGERSKEIERKEGDDNEEIKKEGNM